jgi:hypothetical protein
MWLAQLKALPLKSCMAPHEGLLEGSPPVGVSSRASTWPCALDTFRPAPHAWQALELSCGPAPMGALGTHLLTKWGMETTCDTSST